MNPITVSQLNEQIRSLLEGHFGEVLVEGEVSRPTYHTSGHLYFSLKDETSVIRCVMFRSSVRSLAFRLEDGQRVYVQARLGVYKPRGEYQLYVNHIEPAGIGALKLAYEQLKQKLASEGLFDERFKQPLPKFITSIALVTSKTGAALQDMLRIIQNRWPMVKVYVVDTLVQGKEAAPMIAEAIATADRLGVDAIVVGRGGGSLEDLWAFNEEVVARAIFEAKTPVVSAVGHEIDYLISDFVADLRAPTPSAAMEMILPDQKEVMLFIDTLMERLDQRIEGIVAQKKEMLDYLLSSMHQQAPLKKLEFLSQQIEQLMMRFIQTIEHNLAQKEQLIPYLHERFRFVIEQQILQKEQKLHKLQEQLKLAMESKKIPPKSAQIVKDGRAVELKDVEIGDRLELEDLSFRVEVEVLDKNAL